MKQESELNSKQENIELMSELKLLNDEIGFMKNLIINF